MHKGGGGLGMSSGLQAELARRRKTTEDVVVIWEGDLGNGPAETWSLLSHSSGQEPRILGWEELYRLQREAANADVPADELFRAERRNLVSSLRRFFGQA